MGDEICTILAQAGEYADARRISSIMFAVEKRIQQLESFALMHVEAVDSVEQDVTEDRAETYTNSTARPGKQKSL